MKPGGKEEPRSPCASAQRHPPAETNDGQSTFNSLRAGPRYRVHWEAATLLLVTQAQRCGGSHDRKWQCRQSAGSGRRRRARSPRLRQARCPIRKCMRWRSGAFNAAYKLALPAEADRCTDPGAVGALLRREGLYSLYHPGSGNRRSRDGTLGARTTETRAVLATAFLDKE